MTLDIRGKMILLDCIKTNAAWVFLESVKRRNCKSLSSLAHLWLDDIGGVVRVVHYVRVFSYSTTIIASSNFYFVPSCDVTVTKFNHLFNVKNATQIYTIDRKIGTKREQVSRASRCEAPSRKWLNGNRLYERIFPERNVQTFSRRKDA